MTNNKISIIIAIYNVKPYLGRCLDSVISQTHRNLEIILVDDGSNDGSELICDEYREKDNRIKVIHKKNGGLSDAWNTGLLAVTGDYIGYVDGDDFIEPDMYGKMINALNENDAEIAICRIRFWGNDTTNREVSDEVFNLTNTEAIEFYLSEDDKYRIMPSVWSKLYTRNVVKGLEFIVGKNSQDIMYTTSALCNANHVAYVDSYLYNYNVIRNDSITNKKNNEKRLNVELIPLRERIKHLRSRGFNELSDKAAYYFYRRMLFYYIDFKNERNKEQSRRVIEMLRGERRKIMKIYRNTWVKFGDMVRMRVFLFCPPLYYMLAKGRDKLTL